MATVEKRRSSRKSGHRKHNDGGYSDTETDREVSSLTDRAFRSLCIGDEAVYNDSDLCASPCAQKDTGRQELKRTAHESFSLRVQQYEQDWMNRGTYGAEIHKDQQWGVYGERGAQESLFQQSLVEAPQQEQPPRELSLFSNGTTEVSSQQRRSHSRVSSLIRAFNSEGQGDEAMYNDDTSWDKSALMCIERELSEFSSYPQNMNAGHFPSTGIFSSQNTNYYSSEVAAISQMNSASSFMRSSHSMSTQVNPNFFIHSEFSPFKVWRDQNRFPFHRGQVSGFMPHSEFQKWYETPMYKELSLQSQHHPYMFPQGYHTNTFAPAVPMNPQRSTSASTMMHRASAVEKRCESELAGQYRKRAQSTGANRLPPQRPSTASPSSEMSRQVRDTISSVKSLQQKIKMMAEQNIETQSQEGFYNNDYLNSYPPMAHNTVNSNPYTAPYQMQTSPVYPLSEPQQLLQHHSVSPQPIEHAPVRAESRGATPDVKMSSYKSRAASLLYNLKDNRKRVKATYNIGTFKGQDTQEKYKQEPKDFIIDVPEFSANELVNSTDNGPCRFDVPHYGYQAHSPGVHTQNSQPTFENVPQYGYQACSTGMLQNSQYVQNFQQEFLVENSVNKLNVPQYGYQAHSPGMLQNSQHMQNSQNKLLNPIEDSRNKLNVPQYGYQVYSPGMQQNIQFPQYSQNTQNSQQLYPGQNSSEYYRRQMQGAVAPHQGFTGYTPEYYANTQLANGQNPYENTSSFTPYKQSMSDKGGGNYVNQFEQNTEVQRFGAVVQSRDYVSKDNSKQQFNEAASREYTGVDRYNQLKENKYDYNNVYSQDVWGQTNSQQIQKPGIPSAQNYQNINAYQRTNTQENVLNYNYEQNVMENYGTRPHGTSNVSNQMLQYAQPHPANTGNAGYNAQQPGTYRDIYAPPTSQEFNNEIKMKENYAPQDNHKYYDQDSKKQTTISSQPGMHIATEELGQRKGEAIKEIWMKETRHFEKNEQEKKTEDISTRDRATNEHVFLQPNKTNVHRPEVNETKERSKIKPQPHKQNLEKDAIAKDGCVQDKDLPTAEELIKQLRGENLNCDHVAVQEATDKQERIMEDEPQRSEPEEPKLIVEHAKTEELKKEAIKCELAASSEEARIEQVKPEPSRMERVITEQATEKQVGVEHVERMTEEARKDEQAVIELKMESQINRKPEKNKDIEIVHVKDKTPATEEQKSQEDKEVHITAIKVTKQPVCEERAKTPQIPKEDASNVNNVESLSKSESKQPVTCEPDKVEHAKPESVQTKTELAKIKEKMKEEQKDQKDREDIEQVNDNGHILSKEPLVTMPSVDLADRGADDFEDNREKHGCTRVTVRNKTSTTGNTKGHSTKDEFIENKVDTNQKKKTHTNSKVISDAKEDNEKTYDDPTGSQYVYSESLKEFKLTVNNVTNHEDTKDIRENVSTKEDAPNHEDTKDIRENVSTKEDAPNHEDTKDIRENVSTKEDAPNHEDTKDIRENVATKEDAPNHEDTKDVSENVATKEDAPIEKVEKYDACQSRNYGKQLLVNECKTSLSNLPDNADKEAILKNAGQINNVPVEKVDKYDISQQKDVAKQVPIERRTKSSDQKTGLNKETSIKGLTHKEKVQTKHEILASKIKAHAEKEISAIKEGFAVKDGLKNPTKPLGIGQNVSIRQKPPSQEVHKKQDRPISGDTSKVQSLATVTATGQPPTLPQKYIKNNEKSKEKVATEPNKELSASKISSSNHAVQNDEKTVKPHEDKSLEQDHLSKGVNINRAKLENTAPSLEFQKKSSAQDNSLTITGIMATVREQNPLECKREENKDQDVLQVRCHNTDKHGPFVETNITRLSDKVRVAKTRDAQDYKETMHGTSLTDSMTGLESAQNNLTESNTEKTPQQESSSANDRAQSVTLLPKHLAEKVVPPTLTVPSKNKVSVETQPLPNKQEIIAEETKVYANKPPNAALETTSIKDQEDITEIKTKHTVQPKPERNRVLSVSTTSNKKTQEVNLHIDSIAIRVMPAVTEELNKTQQRTTSNNSVTEQETKNTHFSSQKSVPSNDDVQKVLSSVRKQAQLLKNSNQQSLNNTSSESTENKKGDEIKTTSIEEGYFQVDKRDTGPQNSPNVGESLESVSKEREQPTASLHYKPSSASKHDQNIKTSKQIDNTLIDKSSKDVKPEANNSLHTRRHHMAKGRQRGLSTLQDNTDSTVEVKPKPKVPIPEISALADYARLKVIVSKDDEDTVQEQQPNKKEGFFPLIQSRHSRRPVFTVDSQEDHVKEKSSQNQSDAQAKVSKDPTPILNLFPITDKQHQKTGMFKLGAKENNNTEVQNIQDSKPRLMEQMPQDKTNNGVKTPGDKIKEMLEKSRAKQAEEEKRAAQREGEQRAREREAITAQIRDRRKKQQEAESHAEEEGKGNVVEQQIHTADKEQKEKAEERGLLQQKVTPAVNTDKQQKLSEGEQSIETKPDRHDRTLQQQKTSDAHRKTIVQKDERKSHVLDKHKEEQQRRAVLEESQNKTAQEQKNSKLLEEPQRKAEEPKKDILEEQRWAAQIEEQKKRLFLEEQQKRAAQEEQQTIAAQIEERKRKAAEEMQLKKAAQEKQTRIVNEEQQRKAEEQKRDILGEKQKKAAQIEEEKRRLFLDEQQRRAAQKEQQRKVAEEEQQKHAAALEEQKKQAAFKEQHRKMAHAAQEEKKQKASLEEQQRRAAQEEQQRKMVAEDQRKQVAIIEEHKKQAAINEHHRKMEKAAQEEQKQKAALEEQQRRAAQEEQQRRAAQEEQQRKMVAEDQRKQAAIIEEHKKQAAINEHHRKMEQAAQEEQKEKAALEEQQRRAAQEEQQRKMVAEDQRKQAAILEEQKKRAVLEEKQRKVAYEEQQRQAAQEEQKQKAALEEQQRQTAEKEQQRKMVAEDQRKQAAILEEQKKRAVLEEKQRKVAYEEEQRQAAQEEQKQKAALEEQQRQTAEKEQQRKMVAEDQRKQAAILEEQKKQAAINEHHRKMAQAAQEEQKQKAALEEQKRQAAQKEQQRKIAEEEQQRQAAVIEKQKKTAALEEQQRNLAYEEQQRQAAQEKQKQKAALEEQKRQATQKEQQRKRAEEEQQRQAAIIEEQKKRTEFEEHQTKLTYEEQQRQAAQEEQKQKAALKEQQRRAAQKEQLRKMAEEEQLRKTTIIEEQKKRAAIEEQQRKATVEEQQRRAAQIEEQKRKAAVEEQQRKVVLKEEQRRATLEEQQRKNKMAEEEHQRKEALEEQRKIALIEEARRKAAHEEQLKKAAVIEEQKKREALQEQQQRKAELEEQKRKAAIEEQRKIAQIKEMRRQAAREEQLKKMAEEQQKAALIEEERAVLEDQQRGTTHEELLRKSAGIEERERRAGLEEGQKIKAELEEQKQKATKEEERRKAQIEKQRRFRQEEEEKQLAYIKEERIRRQIEEEREAQIEEERPRRQQNSVENPTHKGKDTRLFRGQDLSRNQTEEQKNISEKTEALQYYSFTSAEAGKPLPSQKKTNTNGPEIVEDTCRPYAPVSPATSLPRSSASSPALGIKPSMFKVKDNTIRGSSLTKSIKQRFHKNFGEEFRVGSPMERVWDKNESDQDILRCKTPSTHPPQYRPFSRRSLVLDEEDSHSIISNMSEDVESFATSATDLADIRALYDSDRPDSACSFSSDMSRSYGKPPVVPPKSEKALRRAKRLATRRLKKELSKNVTEDSYEASRSEVSNSDVVASPHFTAPISIACAPPAGTNVSSSQSVHSPQHSLHTTSHATGPISVPNTSPQTSTPVSGPSSQNPGLFPNSAAPRSIPQVPSSPTNHHAPKPVTQYQVESGFSQSYTQRRVMQDIGSGQYYVVDVPVEVKTKTFFDPETGKYVQLNVREANRNATQRQPLQGYPQPHLKTKVHAKPQPNPSSNAQYQGYSSNSKGYHSGATSSGPVNQLMTSATVTQDQQPIRSSRTHQHGGQETGFSYSPDKTPYMDTVNNVDKAHHAVYNAQEEISEGDNQLVNSRYGKRDIITMSELEDFMEVSDW